MTVGNSGAAGLRCALVTAIPRSLPARTYVMTEDMLPKTSEVCPAMVSTTPGPVPLYGMCTMRAPVMLANSSVTRCTLPPVPLDA